MASKLRFKESVPGDLSRELQRLGFTDYEAKIYIQLLRTNPVTAYELSKASGVPRANAYHALQSLTRKEAVQPVSEDPVRFVPVPPEVLLEGIASSTQRLCDRLAEDLRGVGGPEDTHYVWTISGEAAVEERVTQMIRGAESSIWIKAQAASLRHHETALREMAARGVEILVILFGDAAEEFRFGDNVRVFLHESNGRTIGTADNLFTITVDHEQLLTANVAGKVFASYTRNRPIVITAESLIRHDYYLAEIMARFGEEIDAAFGPHLQRLREACFTPEQLERFHRQVNLG
ncbi:TrmB family transcriptional regulator [Spiribacter halobius]|uniref:Transcriptional regulator n=1 Tax=Sediminicurvatus halobius TaxID=2182432 RepID=A0A2U2N9N8_9GAMM|nr:helix-turn-helix domain-containing protein [Spiribacter halobius]PWG65818.1 transcriptional regulator [Spiribacter halobius]UEX77860.1 TrmB family transcriptional regulator [Spiribacter halobius]